MILALKLISSFAVPLGLGYLAMALLTHDQDDLGIWEKLFFGYGLGLGFVALEAFLIGLLRIPYGLLTLSALPVAACASLLYILPRKARMPGKAGKIRVPSFQVSSVPLPTLLASGLLIVWLAAKICFVLYEGMTRPIASWDTWANWSAGAKFFYFKHGLVLDSSDRNFFGQGYRAYLGHPLLSPLLQVWTASYLGEFHESLVKAWQAVLYASLLGLFFSTLSRDTSRFAALIATALLASVPLMTLHATDGYADLPMGYYAFAAAICIWRFVRTLNRRMLLLAGIFSGIGIFTKNEGLFFVLANSISLAMFAYFRKKDVVRSLFHYLLPAIALGVPWIAFKIIYHIGYGHEINQEFIGLSYVLSSFWEMGQILFLEPNFNIVCALLCLIIMLNGKLFVRDEIKYLVVIFVLAGTMFLAVYLMSSREFAESLMRRGAANRNILTYISIVYFTTALAVFKTWKGLETPENAPQKSLATPANQELL